jgi:hypothetical protein
MILIEGLYFDFIMIRFFINSNIANRIAAVPPFAGLRYFSDGRNFKKWTGNDSKGLMKVE